MNYIYLFVNYCVPNYYIIGMVTYEYKISAIIMTV